MKILITGGAGFIGSHLCRRLLNEGHEIICLDNFISGQKSNILALLDNPKFSFLEADVTSLPEMDGIDQIYNLACPASPQDYQSIPVETVRTNVLGSLNVLELAVKTKARILQASTSEIYGNPLEHPQKETYWGSVNPIGIRSCYDEGKRCSETLFFDYHRKFGVEIKVARIFNTYGPNMRENDGRVVSNFIVQALKNEKITVNGKGLHTRSFCFVDDLVDGMIRLMNTSSDVTGPVNLGNPSEITINELANKVIEITGSTSEIVYRSIPEDDPERRCPDISLAGQVLSWKPTTKLDDGLKATISYFKSRL